MLDRNIKALFHVFFDSIFDFCNCIIIKRQGYFNFLVTVPHDCRSLHGFITIYFCCQNRRGCIIEINQLVNIFSFQQGRVGIIQHLFHTRTIHFHRGKEIAVLIYQHISDLNSSHCFFHQFINCHFIVSGNAVKFVP